MSSRSFRRVVGLLLSLGNRVNNQTGHKSTTTARAITLDSLVALNQSKSFDRHTTFLQYGASLLQKYAPETVDWKQEDMPSLRRAHKVKWKLWQSEVELMEAKLNSLRARCLQTANPARPSGAYNGGSDKSTATITAARLTNPTWKFVCQAEAEFATLKEEGDKGSLALQSLWQYFGETCSNPSRCDSVLGTLVLFGHQWEQAVEQAVRRERQTRRNTESTAVLANDGAPASLSPVSSESSHLSPVLACSQSDGHDIECGFAKHILLANS